MKMKTLFKLAVLALIVIAPVAFAAEMGTTFATPEEAAQALATAAGAKNREALHSLFGLDADDFVAADQVQMGNDLQKFASAFQVKHQLAPKSDAETILEVGRDDWPFPIPLVK